jgi:acyl-CoA synthetase (AMP-forming)/AMP-acid ligase II
MITYDFLNKSANQLANYLINNGAIKESVIGVMATNSIELIV